jgi:sporulation protein YunB
MPRRPHRPLYLRFGPLRLSRRARLLMLVVVFVLLFYFIFRPVSNFLKELSGELAMSDATDLITLTINNTIAKKLAEGIYDYDYFVSLEKDSEGHITAITSNMTRINTLSAEILDAVIANTDNGELDIRIPLGNLLDSNLLMGRGPDVPVKIIMLTSSFADFRNELVSVGINQTKHQIILEVVVEIDILMPFETLHTKVVSEVLVAETVIVGDVPNTYFDAY